MNNVPMNPLNQDIIGLYADHPEELARRRAIDPDFNHVLAVNIITSHAYQSASDL